MSAQKKKRDRSNSSEDLFRSPIRTREGIDGENFEKLNSYRRRLLSGTTMEHNGDSNFSTQNIVNENQFTELEPIYINISVNKSYINIAAKNQELLTYIKKHAEKAKFTKLKITNTNDLLIFPVDQDSRLEILSNDNLFPGCIKQWGKKDRRPAVIIWGISLKDIDDNENVQRILEQEGVIEWREVFDESKNENSSKKNRKLVKLICNSEKTQLKLMCSDVKIGDYQFPAEPPMGIRRCNNCHDYGHNKDECKSERLCSNCLESANNHDYMSCFYPARCKSCKLNHSTYWKQCEVYKKIKHEKFTAIKHSLINKTKINIDLVRQWEKNSKRENNITKNESARINEINENVEEVKKSIAELNEEFKITKALDLSNSIANLAKVAQAQTTTLNALASEQRQTVQYVSELHAIAQARQTNTENVNMFIHRLIIENLPINEPIKQQLKIKINEVANKYLIPFQPINSNRLFPTNVVTGSNYQVSETPSVKITAAPNPNFDCQDMMSAASKLVVE